MPVSSRILTKNSLKTEESRLTMDLQTLALQLKNNEPTEAFAKNYLKDAKGFLKSVQLGNKNWQKYTHEE